jgi:hypothetical protein
VVSTPGDEGRWFATAKAIGLLDQALELARRSPCDPMTLNRAARDFREKEPRFALEAALLALKWLAQGYGYEVSTVDVHEALGYLRTIHVSPEVAAQTRATLHAIIAPEASCDQAVRDIVTRALG